MRRFPRLVQAYIVAMIVAGAAALLLTLPRDVKAQELELFLALLVPGVLAGLRSLPLVYSHVRMNLTGGILLMAVFLGDPPTACLLAAAVAVLSGLGLRRRLWNVLFMAGVNVLSVGLAAGLYDALADRALLPLDGWMNVLALSLAATAYWLANSALVTILVASRDGEMVWRAYVSTWREAYILCILVTLLAILGTVVWHQGPLYAALLFVPAVAVYQLLSFTKEKQEQVVRAIEIISEVLDRRNPFTFQHSERVADHVVKVTRALGLSAADVEVLRKAALIHDVGKLGIDDPTDELPANTADITDYQFYCLKQHAQLGAMIAREIPAFEEAEHPIHCHHDWYDGSHVSRAHSGQGIPLGARIIAVANAYDRLCMANGDANLAYDPIAAEQLRSMGGRQLDPEIVALFLGILESERSPQPAPAPIPRSAVAVQNA